MAHVRTKYIVYNHNGTGVRHHHFSSSNNIIDATDDNYPGSTNANPGTHTCYGFPTSPDANQYPFAFMSVSGNTDDDHLYTSPGNPVIHVGDTDVNVLVVYGPKGGIGDGKGGPGVWVDAFNVDTGNFSDDLHFITVLTPPTPPDSVDSGKTDYANMEGVISTAAAENFRASDAIDGGSARFIEWKKIIPSPAVNNQKDISLSKNETGEIWFAFYQTPKTNVPRPVLNDRGITWIYLSPGVLVDAGGWGIGPDGKPHPIDPWGPLFAKLLTTMGLLSLSTNMDRKLQEATRKLAAEHLDTIKESILAVPTKTKSK